MKYMYKQAHIYLFSISQATPFQRDWWSVKKNSSCILSIITCNDCNDCYGQSLQTLRSKHFNHFSINVTTRILHQEPVGVVVAPFMVCVQENIR